MECQRRTCLYCVEDVDVLKEVLGDIAHAAMAKALSWRPHRRHSRHYANGYGHDVDCIVHRVDARDLQSLTQETRQLSLGWRSKQSSSASSDSGCARTAMVW
eukprot:6253113-Amphidinium_carterae.2